MLRVGNEDFRVLHSRWLHGDITISAMEQLINQASRTMGESGSHRLGLPACNLLLTVRQGAVWQSREASRIRLSFPSSCRSA